MVNNPPIESVPDCMFSVSKTGEKIVSSPKKRFEPTKKRYKKTSEYDSDVDNEFDDLDMDFDSFCGGDGPYEDDVLYFVLKENYHVKDFKFDCLRGSDLELANTLQSCRFLDVHLAVVKDQGENHDNFGRRRYEQHTVEISRWIDSNNVSLNLSMGISWRDQLVGSLGKLLSFDYAIAEIKEKLGQSDEEGDWDYEGGSDEENSDEENSDEEYSDEEYSDENSDTNDDRSLYRTQYNFILVIWPKIQSFQMYCRYDLHSLLNSLEKTLSSASTKESEEAERDMQIVNKDFKKIIALCCSEPEKIWGEWVEKDNQKGDLTSRLLRFCIALRAREEGLAIVKVLGVDFEAESKFCKFKPFEGIKSVKVAKAIAEFECQITGKFRLSISLKRLIFQ